jgi:hypothetical protein
MANTSLRRSEIRRLTDVRRAPQTYGRRIGSFVLEKGVVMKCFISLLVAAALAVAVAVPASAQPADNGPRPVAHVDRATPTAPAGDDGTPAYVYVLIGCGAALALGAGGFMGARSVTRRPSPRAS